MFKAAGDFPGVVAAAIGGDVHLHHRLRGVATEHIDRTTLGAQLQRAQTGGVEGFAAAGGVAANAEPGIMQNSRAPAVAPHKRFMIFIAGSSRIADAPWW